MAPLHLKVSEPPEHIELPLTDAVTGGKGFTITVTVSVAVQVPVAAYSVYVALTVGHTVTVELLAPKGTQE